MKPLFRPSFRLVAALVAGIIVVASVVGAVLAAGAVQAAGDLRVGVPRQGDAATYGYADGSPAYRVTYDAGPSGVTERRHEEEHLLSFEWAGTRAVLDPWGRAVEADLVRLGGAWGIGPAEVPQELLYAGGTSAFANVGVYAWGESSGSSELVFREERSSSWKHLSTRYGPQQGFAECFVRSAWQGRALDEIASIPVAEACPVLATGFAQLTDDGWHEIDGVETRRFVGGGGDATFALHFAPGVAYPVRLEAPGSPAIVLTGLRIGDGGALRPAPDLGAPDALPASSFAEVTRAGPRDGATGYPLEEAVAALEADPQLTKLAAWRRAHAAAFVGMAVYTRFDVPCEIGTAVVHSWMIEFRDGTSGFPASTSRSPPCAPVALPGPLGDLATSRSTANSEGDAYEMPYASEMPARSLTLSAALRLFDEQRAAKGLPVGAIVYLVEPGLAGEAVAKIQIETAFDGSVEGKDSAIVFDAATGAVQERALWKDVRTTESRGLALGPLGEVALVDARVTPLAVQAAELPQGVYAGTGAFGLVLLLAALAGLRAPAAAIFAYTRLTRSDVLANPKRAAILAAATASPGLSHQDVRSAAGLSAGGASYHLAVLVRSGHLARLESGGYTRYFVAGSADFVRFAEEAVLLTGGAEARALAAARAEPGLAPAQLARRLGVSRVAVHYTLKRLEERGLVERRREGARVTVVPRSP